MQFSLLILGLISFASFIMGMLILARSYKKPYGWFLGISAVFILVWGLGAILLLESNNSDLLRIGANLFYICPTIIPVGTLFFAFSFPENAKVPKNIILVSTALVAGWAYTFIFHFSLVIKSVTISEPLNTIIINPPGFFIYAVFFSVFFLGTYYVLFKKYKNTSSGTKRSQIAYTMFGVTISSILAMVTNLLLPQLGITNYIWLGPILASIYIIPVSYAIIKHSLFDVRLVIARSVAYLLSLGVLIFAYLVVTYWLTSTLLDNQSELVRNISLITLMLVSALTFAPLKSLFDKLSNKIFYRDAYDPQAFLDELNETLVANIELETLMRKSSEIITKYLRPIYCAIVIKIKDSDTGYRLVGLDNPGFQPEDIGYISQHLSGMNIKQLVSDEVGDHDPYLKKIMDNYEIGTIDRLTSNVDLSKEAIGYLILGYKKSGGPYSSQDLRIVAIISAELIIAIQNALRFEEIQEFNATLQAKVNDATAELQKTNQKLRELDESKDEFISMASHQLRTPLTAAKGYLSMVIDGDGGKITAKQKNMLNQAYNSSQRMVNLIADLLNVSRLKTGKFVIDSAPTNLVSLVASEIDQLKEAAKTKNHQLIFKHSGKFPDLMLDETKIRQVIMNFADNAIYYTPAGGQIEIKLEQDNNNVYFKVKDNGIGVPAAEKTSLFTKFYRANNARQARPDGTGLGLFMAKKVVDAQGGHIIFDSKLNQGSTFGFTFNKKKLAVSKT